MSGSTASMTSVRSQPLTKAMARPAKHMDMLKMKVPTFSPIAASSSTESSLMAVSSEPVPASVSKNAMSWFSTDCRKATRMRRAWRAPIHIHIPICRYDTTKEPSAR